MSFRSERSQLNALIAITCCIFMAGCSAWENRQVITNAVPPTSTQSVFMWETIDGGVEGIPILTGLQDVRFKRPDAVAARGNFIYVVDGGHDSVFRIDRDFGKITVIKDLKGIVAGSVSDIYVDRDLSFYITDTEGGRVLHFDRNGNQIQVFQDQRNLARPVAVAVDEVNGRILIADGFNDDVLVFNRLGALLGAIGVRGLGQGQFTTITAMAQGPDGIYITSRLGEHRVQVMANDGQFVQSFQKDSIVFPTAIVVDADNRVFVSDFIDNTIKIYLRGQLVDKIGGTGSGPGRFKHITDMWLDEGFLYVADSLNGRIQVLRVITEPGPAPVSESAPMPEPMLESEPKIEPEAESELEPVSEDTSPLTRLGEG